MAAWGNKIAPVELQDPVMRGMCFYFPLVLMVLIILAFFLVLHISAGRIVTLRPDALVYTQRNYTFAVRWSEVTLVKPPPDKKGMFLSALVSDGVRFGRIDKVLFPDYDLIISVIEHAREVHRSEHRV